MVNWYVWTRAVFAAYGGVTFGYDIGAINGVKDMVGFRETFNLSEGGNRSESMCDDDVGSSAILGVIVAALLFGCLVGALLAGSKNQKNKLLPDFIITLFTSVAFSDFAGRKVAIIVGGVLYAVGGILQCAAVFLWMIFLGRIIGGLGVGIVYTVVPVYIAEISPKEIRGRLISFISLGLTGGVLLGFVVNLICQQYIFGWRISLSLQILIGIVLVIGMLFLPEPPRWLVTKHKDKQAAKVLARILHSDEKEVEEEISSIKVALAATESKHFRDTLRLFFSWKCIQRVIIGVCLQFLNRAVGINVITYYSVSIFCKIGVPAFEISVAVGVVYFLSTFIGIFAVDKLGRKALLLLGTLGMMFSMVVAGTLILAFQVEEGGSTAVGYVVVVFVLFFVFNFAYSYGPVTWVVNGEIHPMKVKGISVSLTTSAFWVGGIVIAQVTPVLLASSLQTSGTFYLLVGIQLAGLLLVLLTLPETKGETLERVDLLFSKPWLERINLVYYLRCECLWSCCKRQRKVNDVDGSRVENQDGCADSGKLSGNLNNGSIPIAQTDNKEVAETNYEEFADIDCEDGHSIEYQTPV